MEGLAHRDTLAETLDARMRAYSERECIGVLCVDPSTLEDPSGQEEQEHLWSSVVSGESTLSRHYRYTSFSSLRSRSRRLSSRLRMQSPGVRHVVCIMGEAWRCALDWITVDLACVFSAYVSVPLHTTFTASQISSVISTSAVSLVFCCASQRHKFSGCKMPVVVFGSPEWNKLINPYGMPPNKWLRILPAKTKDTIITLFHTSGSTGVPKGVIITDYQLNSVVAKGSYPCPRVNFCFKPLGYSSQRKAAYMKLCSGGRIMVHSGNMETLFSETRAACPTSFSAPPRIWSLLYARYKARVRQLMTLRGASRGSAEEEARRQFSKTFGPVCEQVGTGGAIVPASLIQWMKDTFTDMSVSEGYGCSECGSIARQGKKNAHTLVRLESVPELGYQASRGRGLLWVCNPASSAGYYGDSARTSEMFRLMDDGNTYYNTGDIVEYNEQTGDLRVIDRVKNLLRLSSALFVAPEYLENLYSECELVSSMFIYAESSRDCILAVVVPNSALLEGVDDVHSALLEQIRQCAARHSLLPCEVPRALLLEAEPWSVESGLLTPTFKLKRLNLTARYRESLGRLYADMDSGSAAASSDPFDAAVCSILRTGACPGGGERLTKFGIDSVAVVHLQTLLAEVGNKPSLSLMLTGSVAQIRGFVESGADHCAAVDWVKETTLPGNVPPADSEAYALGEDIFLTGCTGFLGIFVLAQCLSLHPSSSCICLVHSSSSSSALQRLKEAASRSRLSLEWYRVVVLLGDLSLPLLGVPHLDSLAPRVKLVIHCGALVNGIFPFPLLRSVNVSSALECLRLQARMVFVSSLSSLCSQDDPSESHSLLSLHPLPSKRGYAASKRVAEILLFKARSLGHEVAVVRPGTIGGTRRVYNRTDTLPRFISGALRMGSAPRLDKLVAAADVRAVAWVCCTAVSGVYHIRGHEGLSVSQIGRALGLPLVSFEEWKQALLQVDPSNPLYALREEYFRGGGFPLGSSRRYEDARASALQIPAEWSLDITPEHISRWAHWLRTIAIDKAKV